MTNRSFAAFIMTYERSSILKKTIDTILAQTFPPEKIIVVDNSESHNTESVISSLNYPQVVYHRMGFNAGPAGASHYGLKTLADEGYAWIYWCDDDDPPKFPHCFQRMFENLNADLPRPGLLGAVGHAFNWRNGEFVRTSDEQIAASEWVSVDLVAGNMCMVVNAEAVRQGILPDADLFFGMEELDFCLKLKHAGYNIFVNAHLFKLYREVSERPLSLAGIRGLKKKPEKIWREYYSTKNLLFIVGQFNKPWLQSRIVLKSLIKTIYNFRYGMSYGLLNGKLILWGILDFFRNRKGWRDIRPRSLNLN